MIESTNALSLDEFAQAGWQLGHLNAADHAGSGPFDQLRLNVSSSAVARMMVCITDFSLWFSLPLSIWLTAGWIGLIVHWQAVLKNGLPEGKYVFEGKPNLLQPVPAEWNRRARRKKGWARARWPERRSG
jgi:hypothetical protein